MLVQIHKSQIDGTVNGIYDDGSEFRLVEKPHHDVVYLSSHTGCSLGCKQCHLTSTRQTTMTPLSAEEICWRAKELLDHRERREFHVNFAFMARGDALANRAVNGQVVQNLYEGVRYRNASTTAKVTISTIFPRMIGQDIDVFMRCRFGAFQPHLYWSLYTLSSDVRNEWMPEAQDPIVVLPGLLKWQRTIGHIVTIHFPVIRGVNDDPFEHMEMADLLDGLIYKVNLVRYNPPNENSKEASPESYDHLRFFWDQAAPAGAKIQERIGYDVNASCGMFYSGRVRDRNDKLRPSE